LSNTTTSVASVLGGSSFPLGFSFGRPITSIPIHVAVQGIGTINASVIPVVISATGQNASFFRTSLQLYNPAGSSAPAIGRLVFWGDHGQPLGAPLSSAASLAYSIAPGTILSIPDLLAAVGLSGLFSVDVIVDSGPSPVGVARIFNDQGDAGTAGFTEDLLNESSSLGAGDTGVLIAPADPVNFRFNVGIRTLAAATYTVTIRDSAGNVRAIRDSSRSSEFISQDPASHFPDFCCGVPIGASDTITIEVKRGRVFLYGATADNRTNDSSFQLARRVSSLRPTPIRSGYIMRTGDRTARLIESRSQHRGTRGRPEPRPSRLRLQASLRCPPRPGDSGELIPLTFRDDARPRQGASLSRSAFCETVYGQHAVALGTEKLSGENDDRGRDRTRPRTRGGIS
jgi:hypothetical protein